ncbi:MAG: hypothetical protein RL367_1305 [Pseudomonadota bacterium]|jgi:CheY-like chemotaxis protein
MNMHTSKNPASGQFTTPEAKIRVLYIEDDAINRMVVRDMLSAVGIAYDEAIDGVSGLQKIEHGHYDMVLLDLRMPEMDGMEVARTIRARPDGKATLPIVVITADTGANIRQGCIAAGANEMLLKPVSMQALLDAICRYVSSANANLMII